MELFSDEYFMKKALYEAHFALEKGEVPVGAIVVCNNKIIAKGYNQVELLQDVTAHAEIIALTAASNNLGAKYLNDCTLYVTLEPCLMCAGALYWSQIGKIVYGASDEKRGFKKKSSDALHPKTEVVFGILENDCRQIIQDFFKSKRES
jgi:tRNA(adenine34) deaminase